VRWPLALVAVVLLGAGLLLVHRCAALPLTAY
jgi:hypothetical protein